MGMLVDGQWRDEDPVNEIGKAGTFQRVDSVFRDRIPASSASQSPSRACANKAGRSRTIRRFPIARRTVSTASATCTRRIQRAIRITPAR